MSKFEIACFICGLVLSSLDNSTYKGFDSISARLVIVRNIICHLIYGLMVLLPLYFNFWRK